MRNHLNLSVPLGQGSFILTTRPTMLPFHNSDGRPPTQLKYHLKSHLLASGMHRPLCPSIRTQTNVLVVLHSQSTENFACCPLPFHPHFDTNNPNPLLQQCRFRHRPQTFPGTHCMHCFCQTQPVSLLTVYSSDIPKFRSFPRWVLSWRRTRSPTPRSTAGFRMRLPSRTVTAALRLTHPGWMARSSNLIHYSANNLPWPCKQLLDSVLPPIHGQHSCTNQHRQSASFQPLHTIPGHLRSRDPIPRHKKAIIPSPIGRTATLNIDHGR